jgi:hypothetical protein
MSAKIELLLQHQPREPYTPAGAHMEFCNLCKRPVQDPGHGPELRTDDDWEAILASYFESEQVEATLLAQIEQRGRKVNPESIRSQRHELLWEQMLQKMFTDEERLEAEARIYLKMADGLQSALVQIDAADKEEQRQQKMAVVQRPTTLLGPDGLPARR